MALLLSAHEVDVAMIYLYSLCSVCGTVTLTPISSPVADDKYRVQLETKSDCVNPSDYINASHLDVSRYEWMLVSLVRLLFSINDIHIVTLCVYNCCV